MKKSNVTSFPKEKVSKENNNIQNSLSPREIVSELDRFVVGQNKAKRAVAIALRNRWRREALTGDKKDQLLPKSKPTIVKKEPDKIDGIILPKSKPLVAKKEINKTKEKSKYFKQRDFRLAKSAIKEMEK